MSLPLKLIINNDRMVMFCLTRDNKCTDEATALVIVVMSLPLKLIINNDKMAMF